MTLQDKRVAILVEDEFEDSELLEPLKAMRERGAQVTVVGSGAKDTYKGKRGATIRANTTADKVEAQMFDAIIVPGGHAPDKMRLSQPMIDLVKQAYAQGKVIAAICHGPQLLISADILRGHTLTSWLSVAVDVKNAGANWVDQPVVKDGNLITSRKPADLPQFNQAIIETLATG